MQHLCNNPSWSKAAMSHPPSHARHKWHGLGSKAKEIRWSIGERFHPLNPKDTQTAAAQQVRWIGSPEVCPFSLLPIEFHPQADWFLGGRKGIPLEPTLSVRVFPLFAIVTPVVTPVTKQTSEKTQWGVNTDSHRADNCTFHLFTSSNKPIPGVTFINKRHYQVPDMWLTEINYQAHGKAITSPQCCNICANWKWDKCCGCNLHSMHCINYL